MAHIITTKREVFASYLFTMSKYDFSIYEKRIIYRLLELAQMEIQGLLIKDHMYKVHKPDERRRVVTMPVTSILKDEDDKNYAIAKKAFKTLACKGLEYEDDKIWTFINIITGPKIDKTGGKVTFEVYDEIWQCFLDFTSGFRRYDFLVAMNFKSTYTMRMYELMAGQETPLTFINAPQARTTFDSLCDRFKLTKKMSTPQKFEEKVLDVAKEELDAYSPFSFTYKRETIKSRGRNGEKVIGYTFYPKINTEPKKLSVSGKRRIDPKLYEIISQLFTDAQIFSNQETFEKGYMYIDDLYGFIMKKAAAVEKIKETSDPNINGIGYIINAIKGEAETRAMSSNPIVREQSLFDNDDKAWIANLEKKYSK